MFQVVEFTKGDSYFHVQIRDAIVGDEPEYRVTAGKTRFQDVEPRAVAVKVAAELNEARGLLWVTKIQDGIPVGTWCYASNGRHVYGVPPGVWAWCRTGVWG